MAIAKNPKRNQDAAKEKEAEAFIAGAGLSGTGLSTANQSVPTPIASTGTEEHDQNKKPIMVRVDPDLLTRIDRAAKRLGLSRSAFIVSSAAERLERME